MPKRVICYVFVGPTLSIALYAKCGCACRHTGCRDFIPDAIYSSIESGGHPNMKILVYKDGNEKWLYLSVQLLSGASPSDHNMTFMKESDGSGLQLEIKKHPELFYHPDSLMQIHKDPYGESLFEKDDIRIQCMKDAINSTKKTNKDVPTTKFSIRLPVCEERFLFSRPDVERLSA